MILFKKLQKGQRNDYTTGCLLDYNYFNNYYKMIAIDLSKQQELDADPQAMQQINFTGNLDWAEEAKKTRFRFFTGNYETIVNVFHTFILFYIKLLNMTL